jgi:hypothetical protein
MLFLFILFTAFSAKTNAQGITFTFANGQTTTDGINTYFEFDVMAVATANTQFKLAQVYINYSTVAFGFSIWANANVTITKGSLLANFIGATDIGLYGLTLNDNTTSKLSIANTFTDSDELGGDPGFDITNTLGTTPKVYVHVKIKVQNTSASSGLSFDNTISQFDEQQYYFSSGNTTAQYSPVNIGSGLDSPTPVELSSFTVKTKQNIINLNWQTKTEVNNYGFEIERASSSTSPVQDWEKIGFVNGNGNSNSPKDYSFIDKNPVGGTKFVYRLKQIDNDGQFEYSKEVEVEVVPNEFALYQNYPNPFNPATNIKFSLPKAARVNLSVYNLLGENIATLLNEEKEAGFYNVQFDASSLSSGVYIYRLTTEDFIQIKKMNFIK